MPNMEKGIWRRVGEVWTVEQIRGSHGISLWKGIRSGWDSYSNFLWFEVRDWSKVKFWKNIWCGDCFLRDLCPNLFDLAVDNDALVSSYRAGHWNPHFIWLFQDWELEAFHMFLGALYDNLPTSFGQDQALWFGIKERSVWGRIML